AVAAGQGTPQYPGRGAPAAAAPGGFSAFPVGVAGRSEKSRDPRGAPGSYVSGDTAPGWRGTTKVRWRRAKPESRGAKGGERIQECLCVWPEIIETTG